MARRQARAAAVQMVYENLMGGDGGNETLLELIEFLPEEGDQEYIDRIVQGVEEHQEALDELISSHLRNWTLERIPKVDQSILRVAFYELQYEKETPENVICSEAVTLAQQFSTENSGKFVNGVLGTYVRARAEQET